MPVILRPYGILKSYTNGQGEIILPAGQTVRQVLTLLGIPSEVVALVSVNDEMVMKDYLLQEGDIVKLMAVIGGGGS